MEKAANLKGAGGDHSPFPIIGRRGSWVASPTAGVDRLPWCRRWWLLIWWASERNQSYNSQWASHALSGKLALHGKVFIGIEIAKVMLVKPLAHLISNANKHTATSFLGHWWSHLHRGGPDTDNKIKCSRFLTAWICLPTYFPMLMFCYFFYYLYLVAGKESIHKYINIFNNRRIHHDPIYNRKRIIKSIHIMSLKLINRYTENCRNYLLIYLSKARYLNKLTIYLYSKTWMLLHHDPLFHLHDPMKMMEIMVIVVFMHNSTQSSCLQFNKYKYE